MTSGTPWSVKGIDPKAREVAKDLARRSGMTLGEWLNRVILDDEGPEELTSQDQFPQRSPRAYSPPPRPAEREPERAEAVARPAPAPEPPAPPTERGFAAAPQIEAPKIEASRFEAPAPARPEPPARAAEQIARATHDPFALRPARDYRETPRNDDSAPARVEAPAHPEDAPAGPEPRAVQAAPPAAARAEEVERMLAAFDTLSERIEAAEASTSQAISGVERSVREAVARIEANEREQVAVAARFEGVVEELAEGQGKLAERLRRYETDGSGPRSAAALHSLEQALGRVAGHLYEGENRTREMLGAVEARVQRLETGGVVADAEGLAEQVMGRFGERLAEAQARTTDALEGLRASFAALDGRLQAVEGDQGQPAELRLSDLAASLTSRVEAARAEIAERLGASADERFDRVERKLAEMAEHVGAAEQRSAEAIEQMGREVASIADAFNRKVQDSEARGAEAITQVGGEVARIASAMETRLGRSDSIHAEALERLSGEITKITERLGERISAAERRSAQAMDEVGEQMARVTDRINQRQERATEDLAERIRQSEERTARILDEARERIDQRLSEAQRRLVEPAAPVQRGFAAFAPASAYGDLGPPEPDRRAEIAIEPAPLAAFPAAATFAPQRAEPAFDDEDFDAADGFGATEDSETLEAAADDDVEPGQDESAAFPAPDESVAPEPPPAVEAWSAATDLVEDDDNDFDAETEFLTPSTARFDAEAADEPEPADGLPEPAAEHDATAGVDLPEPGQEDEDLFEPASEPARPQSTREVIEQARLAARAAMGGDRFKAAGKDEAPARPSASTLFAGFGLPKSRKKRAGGLQTALLVAGGAAFLSVGAAGLVVMGSKPGGPAPKRVAESQGAASEPALGAETEIGAAPRAAIAVGAQGFDVGLDPAQTPDPSLDLASAYAAATRAIEAQEAGGVEALKKTANLGYAPAQLYLATLYEAGGQGVKQDLAEARLWTERAARGGERKAMHNLALYAFEGVGGQPKNPALAAQWFRRAADLGLLDSQYNLGRLYEQGLGVNLNPAEAYKWYLIAARSGDEESRAAAQRVRARLSADAQVVAERAAAGFRSASPDTVLGSQDTQAPAVETAQRALSRLGYYQGPRDGRASPALTLAIAAYQREQGLPATGALDDVTVGKLAVFTR